MKPIQLPIAIYRKKKRMACSGHISRLLRSSTAWPRHTHTQTKALPNPRASMELPENLASLILFRRAASHLVLANLQQSLRKPHGRTEGASRAQEPIVAQVDSKTISDLNESHPELGTQGRSYLNQQQEQQIKDSSKRSTISPVSYHRAVHQLISVIVHWNLHTGNRLESLICIGATSRLDQELDNWCTRMDSNGIVSNRSSVR